MEIEQTEQGMFDISIDTQTIVYLNEMARWCRFLSIAGFIFLGIMFLVSVYVSLYTFRSFDSDFGMAGILMEATRLMYLIVGFLYFFPCLFLYKFSLNMRVALRNNDQESLNISFKNLKSCFKFLGILTMVILGIYILAFIGRIIVFAL